MSRLACLLVLALAACKPSTEAPKPAVPPAVAPPPAAPSPAPPRIEALTLEQARVVLEAFQNRRATRKAVLAEEPLARPASLDDLLEVLRRDEEALFAPALAFAETQKGPLALALRAQLELTWGEGEANLDALLSRTASFLAREAKALESRDAGAPGSPDDAARVETLRTAAADVAGLGAALRRVSEEHQGKGATLARQLLAEAPADYHGYRVAADYHRQRGEWDAFDAMMTKVDELKPDSVGAIYLRGLEALQRRNDRATAERLFRKALEKDPKFARARAQVLLLQDELPALTRELQALAAVSPRHRLVTFAGPLLEALVPPKR